MRTNAALMHSRSAQGEEGSSEVVAPVLMNGSNISDLHFLPVNAANLTQSLIGWSDEQHQVFEKELDLTDEEPLQVLYFNPNWQGQVAVATVCDAIATFEQRTSRRRRRLPQIDFSLRHYQDLGPCKSAIQAAHPEAFTVSPDTVAFTSSNFLKRAASSSKPILS